MKPILLFITVFLFAVNAVSAQEENLVLIGNSNIEVSDISKSIISNNNFQSSFNNYNNNIQKDYVLVSQIGNSNYSNVNIKSNNSQINILQNGNENFVNIDKNVPQIQESIYQNGNNNYIQDYTAYSNQSSNTQFNQLGNNLTIFSNGTNSISQNLQITQTGDSGTIYIFNQ